MRQTSTALDVTKATQYNEVSGHRAKENSAGKSSVAVSTATSAAIPENVVNPSAGDFPVVIKSDNDGTCEALRDSIMSSLPYDEVSGCLLSTISGFWF